MLRLSYQIRTELFSRTVPFFGSKNMVYEPEARPGFWPVMRVWPGKPFHRGHPMAFKYGNGQVHTVIIEINPLASLRDQPFLKTLRLPANCDGDYLDGLGEDDALDLRREWKEGPRSGVLLERRRRRQESIAWR